MEFAEVVKDQTLALSSLHPRLPPMQPPPLRKNRSTAPKIYEPPLAFITVSNNE